MQPVVSVIVPIYNAHKYLRKCLDSLKSQNMTNIEFILINDGSTDDSGTICEEYASQDLRFKVVHQENQGSSGARQTGLNLAVGEYLIVCDSDDWVEPDMYEIMYNAAKETNADILMCQFYYEYDNGKTVPQLLKNINGPDLIIEIIGNSINNVSWNKLIRRNLYEKGKIYYEPGINLGEDALMLYKILLLNPKISHIPNILYHYRRQYKADTYTNTLTMSKIQQINFVHNWFASNYDTNIYKKIIYYKTINLAFACIRTTDLDIVFFKDLLNKKLKWRLFIQNKPTLKSILVYSCKIFPLHRIKSLFTKLYPFFYK